MDSSVQEMGHGAGNAFFTPDRQEAGLSFCQICSSLDLERNFQTRGSFLTRGTLLCHLGSVSDMLERRECSFCRWLTETLDIFLRVPGLRDLPIVISIEQEFDPDEKLWFTIGRLRQQTSDKSWRDFSELRALAVTELNGQDFENSLVFGGTAEEIPYGPVKSEAVPPTLLKHWLHSCTSTHKICNSNDMVSKTPDSSLRLFDVEIRQVMVGTFDMSYLALSYVCGPTFHVRADSSGRICEVPNTIEDAIKCTKALGCRYIWVDALCILDDDPVAKLSEIRKMDQVYHRAFAVLIAAFGKDANAGLPGVSRKLNPYPSFRFPSVVLSKTSLTESVPFLGSWNERGWTLQEGMFARRRIFFTESQVFFECDMAVGRELSGHLTMKSGGMDFIVNFENKSRQPLGMDEIRDHYSSNCSTILNRTLTYDYDIVHAFQGIANYLAMRIQDKPCWTIPRKIFMWGMLWTPFRYLEEDTPIPRRETEPGGCPSPSWSWVAWRLMSVSYRDSFSQKTEWSASPMWSAGSETAVQSWSEEKWQAIEDTGIIELDALVVNPVPRSLHPPVDHHSYLTDKAIRQHWMDKTCTFLTVPCWNYYNGSAVPSRQSVSALAVVWRGDIAYRIGHLRLYSEEWEPENPVLMLVRLG